MTAALERMMIKRATFEVYVRDEHTEILRRADPGCPREKFVTIPNGFGEGGWDDVIREWYVLDFCRVVYEESSVGGCRRSVVMATTLGSWASPGLIAPGCAVVRAGVR
jgi:hypothetical protein